MVVITFVVNHMEKSLLSILLNPVSAGRIVAFFSPFIDMFLPMFIGFIIFEPILCKHHLHQLIWWHIVVGGAAAWSCPLCIGWWGWFQIGIIHGNCSGTIRQFYAPLFKIMEYNPDQTFFGLTPPKKYCIPLLICKEIEYLNRIKCIIGEGNCNGWCPR